MSISWLSVFSFITMTCLHQTACHFLLMSKIPEDWELPGRTIQQAQGVVNRLMPDGCMVFCRQVVEMHGDVGTTGLSDLIGQKVGIHLHHMRLRAGRQAFLADADVDVCLPGE